MNIKLNLYVFLFIILFIITNQIEIYALIMVFALIHELAHLICGILLDFKASTLKIKPLGFAIEFNTKIEDYNKRILKSNILSIKKIIIALAGPLANIIIAIFGIIYKLDNNIIYSNLLLAIFNFLPIYPLDGGRILKNIFKILYGNKKANTYINTISNIVVIALTMLSSILIIAYKNIAIFFVIITLWTLTIKENKRYFTYTKIYKTIDKNYNYL